MKRLILLFTCIISLFSYSQEQAYIEQNVFRAEQAYPQSLKALAYLNQQIIMKQESLQMQTLLLSTDDSKLLTNATIQLIKQASQTNIAISLIEKDLIQNSGGLDEEGNIIGSRLTKICYSTLRPSSYERKQIEQNLEQYAHLYEKHMTLLKSGYPIISSPSRIELLPEANNYPSLKKTKEWKDSDYFRISFKDATLIESLEILAQKRTEVALLTLEYIGYCQRVLGLTSMVEDASLIVSSESNTVPAGTNYEATVFLRNIPEGQSPKFYLGQREIPSNGLEAHVKFKAAWGGGKIDPKLPNVTTKSFLVKAIIVSDSGEVFIEKRCVYKVKKPIIQLTGNLPLYRGCGNEIFVACPDLGYNYSPRFTMTAAQYRLGKRKGQVIIIPSSVADTITMTISFGGTRLAKELLPVRDVPSPFIELRLNGSTYTSGQAIPKTDKIRLVALTKDDFFKTHYPKDAKYYIINWSLSIFHSGQSVPYKVIESTAAQMSLESIQNDIQSGDRIEITVKDTRRKKYAGGSQQVTAVNPMLYFTVE